MTKETISRYLENGCKGHKNVVSSRELERALGISGNELRRHINRLRRGTVPIAADQRGYYYAETAAEVYGKCHRPPATERRERHRIPAGHRIYTDGHRSFIWISR